MKGHRRRQTALPDYQASYQPPRRAPKAFSSGMPSGIDPRVDTGSREENASNKNLELRF